MKRAGILVILLFAVTTYAAEIASLSFKKVEPVLKEFVLVKPQYAELKVKISEAGTFNPADYIKTDDKGNIVLGKNHMEQAAKMSSRFDVEKQVRDVLQRELVLIVEKMGLTHSIILNADETSALLYSQTEIEDITQRVYQEVIRLMAESGEKEPVQVPK